jgi:hypothetical protein
LTQGIQGELQNLSIECDSCAELVGWTVRSQLCDFFSNSHLALDFRRTLRIGCDLSVLSDYLIDLSQFEDPAALEVDRFGSSHLRRWRSDGTPFVAELIGWFESGQRNGAESGIEKEIEKRPNLRHA